MTDVVYDYFKAQKRDSIYWIALGMLSIALTVFFVSKRQPYYNGLAYVFFATGLIQIITGMTVYLRSDMDRISVSYFIQKDFQLIGEREIPRIELLMKEYAIFWKVEIGCIALGLLLWMFCNPSSLGNGIGIGLTVQAVVLLVLDYLAQNRVQIYRDFLHSLKPQS